MPSKTVIVTGVKSIDRKLHTLELRIQKKVVRQSMRQGLKVMQAEVKARTPVESGLMRSAVVVRTNKAHKRGTISLAVRISARKAGLIKASKGGKKTFYPAIVEYKHDPFMRRSFDAKARPVRDITLKLIKKGIDAEVKRP